MFIDALGLVSDAQAVAADAASTNTIDLGNVTPKREIGTGEPMGFGFSVDVAADATTGDETYEFQVIESANADLSAPTIIAQQAIPRATLVAGFQFFLAIPPGYPKARYLGVFYNVGGTTPSITVTAWLTSQKLFSILAKAYAKNYVV